jgi:uncharacterized surface protein with fasciclin (FAS1) repeats
MENVFETTEPLTFFAPTDAAFSKMPEGYIDTLCVDRHSLIEFLLIHTLPAKLTTREIASLYRPRLICGKRFEVTEGKPMVEGVEISAPDIFCREGVLHGVEGVLRRRPSHYAI